MATSKRDASSHSYLHTYCDIHHYIAANLLKFARTFFYTRAVCRCCALGGFFV